jgi:hypothetical protein
MLTDATAPIDGPVPLDPLEERRLASELFTLTWDYLGLASRTASEDDLMIHVAHASRWHWGRAGGPEQWAIGDWLCSRVYAVLDRGEPALYHAQRCLAVCEEHRIGNVVPASAHEALSRAHAVRGDMELARIERNLSYVAAIDLDDDDRGVIEADLATLPIES